MREIASDAPSTDSIAYMFNDQGVVHNGHEGRHLLQYATDFADISESADIIHQN
jgi:hypothetical protein